VPQKSSEVLTDVVILRAHTKLLSAPLVVIQRGRGDPAQVR
jgi:hypothetical protein